MKPNVGNQLELSFSSSPPSDSYLNSEELSMPDARVIIYRNFFNKEEADSLYSELFVSIRWRQDTIKYYGKEIDLPRLTAWYGDEGTSYTYSHIPMQSDPWTPSLLLIKRRIELVAGVNFNSVLLNLYRHGKDGVSWHQDNERELGSNPVIASVSLGATRRFQFRHKLRKELSKVDLDLTHGSLLIMKDTTQQFWQHQIPKTAKPVEPRINLTFRVITPIR
ncbi:MAG TPA: alpha-ketoglutarate-dependent dioxygenase AlkB [Blastocatellia bacterium]|nr:alpha-ketoglutarate-dependent dioxygenase AlkB [Blastocatellia bacterium]